MANDTLLTITGNLTADPNLRYTQSGAAVADFTIASTPRTFDRDSGQWKDGETMFMRCSVWRDYAENIAASLSKGTAVIAQGRLVQRKYTPKDGGEERVVMELQIEEIGPTLRYATTQVTRTPRNTVSKPRSGTSSQPVSNGPQADPWGTQAATSAFGEEAPF